MAVGDFNNDGNEDLVTTNSNSNDESVLLGDGSGNFGPATFLQLDLTRRQSPSAISTATANKTWWW